MTDEQHENLMERLRTMSSILESINQNLLELKQQAGEQHNDAEESFRSVERLLMELGD